MLQLLKRKGRTRYIKIYYLLGSCDGLFQFTVEEAILLMKQ
jgi:hypothetical protein